MKLLNAIFALVLISCSVAFSQKQNNIWYFGAKAGIDFNSGSPVALANGKITTLEGTSSICDANGNLLFYTDGDTVRDRNHVVMPNGKGLLGGESATQAALIIQKPNSCNLFYIFTVGDHTSPGDFRYSVVDMCLHGGDGDIVSGQKNILLHQPSTEKITAVRHSNGTDMWVVTHDLGTNDFRAFLITPAGINPVPVISSSGSVHQSGQMIGYMKASHNNTKIACAVTFNGGFMEMFDFNTTTGNVSNPVNLIAQFSLPSDGFYGLEFSPNDQLLYAVNLWGTSVVYQLNLSTLSKTSLSIIGGSYQFGAIQLAPDGKIYISRAAGLTNLDVINSPNTSGVGCNYTTGGFTLAPGTACITGLPNFIPNSLINTITYPFSVSLGNDTTLCLGGQLLLNANTGCNSTFLWQDGSTNPNYTVNSTGTYWVQVTSLCGTATDTIHVVFTNSAAIAISGNTTICTGQVATLTASGGTSYSWSTGSTGATITISPSSTTSYSVVATNGSCTGTTSATVTVSPPPVAAVSSSTICSGQNATLSASGGAAYSWSTGNSSASINVSPGTTTTYSVIVSAGSCADTAFGTVTVNPAPSVSISGNTLLCIGDTTTLTASGGTNYSWSNGATTSTISNNTTTTTAYAVITANANGCTGMASVTVTIAPPPVAAISSATICLGQSAILTASGGGNYLWNNGNTSSTITVIPISTSNYSVTVSIGSCTDTASTSVIVNPSPTVTAGGEATISAGSSVTLTAAGGGPYSWNNGDTSASISVSPPGTTVYYVTTTNAYGCTDIDSVVVYVLDPGCGHPENDLFIPNAFSPNGDGENDSVKIEYRQRAACIRSFYFSVFNRWGQKVFETETISDYWDGRSKGGYLFESAVFTYYCKLTTISDETTVKRGNISLLK